MIYSFFSLLQQDMRYIKWYINDRSYNDNERVGIAALRILAAFGMGLSVVTAITAFKAATLGGTIFRLAFVVALYVVSHDLFMIGTNAWLNAHIRRLAANSGAIPKYIDYSSDTFFESFYDVIVS